MQNTIKKIGLVAAILVCLSPFTAGADAYTVKNIEITRPIKGAELPREKALDQLTQAAYVKLLKQITPPATWPRHAWLMSTLPASQAVQKMSIVKEESTPEYTVVADVTFNREKIRKLLSTQGIPFSEVETKTILIIPVYEVGPAKMLWEEQNPWRKALEKQILQEGALQFTLPAGDVAEMGMLTAEMAVVGAQDVRLKMAENYGTDTAIVVRAQVMQQGPYQYMQMMARWHQKEETEMPSVNVRLPVPLTGVSEELLEQAADRLYKQLEDGWRQAGLVAADKPARIYVRYTAPSAKELSSLKETLQKLTAVSKVFPKLLSQDESVYQVDYFGALYTLKMQLENTGYALKREGNMWRIRKAPPQPMPQAAPTTSPTILPYTGFLGN